MDIEPIEIARVEGLVEEWALEIQNFVKEEPEENPEMNEAWDDVNGGELPLEDVTATRKEEIEYMQGRGIWKLAPLTECWNKTGKDPVTVRWVDTNKGGIESMIVRSRLVARDFKGKDNDRDDLFAETPPLEAKRMLLSRAATRRKDGQRRKLLFIDARKAHLNPRCKEDVFIELPEEAECPKGLCGKVEF